VALILFRIVNKMCTFSSRHSNITNAGHIVVKSRRDISSCRGSKEKPPVSRGILFFNKAQLFQRKIA
jgi:hypothetical protein